ncbi:MAG: sensor histidine kinase, partial [Thermomicrobiales bacterium]
MATAAPITSRGEQLRAELTAAYTQPVDGNLASGQPLRESFSAFCRSAGLAGVSLEDTMAAGTDALQELFDRVGGGSSDPSTMIAAGISLAAAARAYQETVTETLQQVTEPVMPTELSGMSALHRVNRAVTAHLELGEMLDTTVRVVTDTTGADACALFLYDAATDSLALRAAVGLNAASVGAVTVRAGVGITGQAARERRSIPAPDAHLHDSLVANSGTGDQVYASQLSVPMVLRRVDRLVGVLNILSIDRRDFDPSEIAFLETIAGEVTISIENARLYSQTDARLRRKVAELGTLQRVSRTVASTLDLASVLRLIAEQAVELINADAAAIFRLPHRPGGVGGVGHPVIEHFVGDERQVINSARDRLVREVVRTGASQAVDIDYIDGSGVVFCLPLRSARETLGALCMRLRPDAELTEDELGLLQAFSDSASLAIENAQLYQDARHGLETASALLQEMHHRVRNNLQTVAALLSLQLRTADDAPWATAIREAVSRIQAIAGIHDLLSDERRLGGTTVEVIARHVVDDVHRTLIPPDLSVRFTIEPSDVTVPSRQATILALLINELISNAISHGFEKRDHGQVTVRASRQQDMVTVEVENDGKSLPEGFVPAESSGLGMKIVQRLVTSDLRGSFRIESPAVDGTIATITFPLADEPADSDEAVLVDDIQP